MYDVDPTALSFSQRSLQSPFLTGWVATNQIVDLPMVSHTQMYTQIKCLQENSRNMHLFSRHLNGFVFSRKQFWSTDSFHKFNQSLCFCYIVNICPVRSGFVFAFFPTKELRSHIFHHHHHHLCLFVLPQVPLSQVYTWLRYVVNFVANLFYEDPVWKLP